MAYDERSISRNPGLKMVRANPQVFIGIPNSLGLFQCLKEVGDNATDEAAAGYGDVVTVTMLNGTCYVSDQGRGIPVKPHPDDPRKRSTLTLIMTELATGGKQKGKTAYKHSIGTHGMGVSITNALSESFEVWTHRGKAWYYQAFSKGAPKFAKPKRSSPPKVPMLKSVYQPAAHPAGTLIKFTPDLSVFKPNSHLDPNVVCDWLSISAYFNPNVKFVFYSKPTGPKVFHHPEGLRAFHDDILVKLKAEAIGDAFFVGTDTVSVMAQWSSAEDEHSYSFVESSSTPDGGEHVRGFNSAVADALSPYAGARSKFKVDDLRAGLVSVVNIRLNSPEFSSQTKEKLITTEARKMVYDAVSEPLKRFFKDHKKLAKEIISRAVSVSAATARFKLSKQAASKLQAAKGGRVRMPEKLAVSDTRNNSERELYLCEGDSAAGTIKDARDRHYQEVLALSGKILNLYRLTPTKIAKAMTDNAPIFNILKSIGYNPESADPVKELRVGKIILLSDSDDDGYHIQVLLLALFSRLMPKVFDLGMIYVVDAPLFMTFYNNRRYYGADLEAVQSQLPKKAKANITRIKGWGEIGPEPMREIACDPKVRKLRRITASSKADVSTFKDFMGPDSGFRKAMFGLGEL